MMVSFKPKHAGAVLLILKYFNNSTFLNVVCISWKLKCWLLLLIFTLCFFKYVSVTTLGL